MRFIWGIFSNVITLNIEARVKSVSSAVGSRWTKVDRGEPRALWSDNKSTQLAERAREACEQSQLKSRRATAR